MNESDFEKMDDVDSFNLFGRHDLPWLMQSNGLSAAAETLWDVRRDSPGYRMFHSYVALMLAGMGLEALLKCLIVAKEGDRGAYSGRSQHLKDFLPANHKLCKLAAHCKIPLNKAERVTLDELTQFVEWAGRYPVPKQATGYSGPPYDPEVADSDARVADLWWRYQAMREKLRTRLAREIAT